MFKSLSLILVFICFNVFSSQAQIPSNIVGNWEGNVIEVGRSDPYHVSMNLKSVNIGLKAGSIWYRDYNCGGSLTFVEIKEGDIYVFKESLTTNGSCIDKGYVAIKIVDGSFSFIWAHHDYKHRAKGILYRK